MKLEKSDFEKSMKVLTNLRNLKIEIAVVNEIWNRLLAYNFDFQDMQSCIDSLAISQERIDFASILKYLQDSRSERQEAEKDIITHREAEKFLDPSNHQSVGRDCILLIKKIASGVITIEDYILELAELEQKYPGIGFLESKNKLQHKVSTKQG